MNYPTKFKKIMKKTSIAEGGFVNDPDDPGGATNMGVTLEVFQLYGVDIDGDGDIDSDDLKLMTKKEQEEVFYKQYWVKNRIDELPTNLQGCVFDMSINFGIYGAIKVLQQAINNKLNNDTLIVDGFIGNNTIYYANKSNLEIERLINFRILRFVKIIMKDKRLMKFYHGWIERAKNIY